MRLREIIDVTPVVGLTLLAGFFFEKLAYRAALAHAGRTQDEKVITFMANRGPEAQGIHGASLPDYFGQVFQVRSSLKLKLCGLAGSVQKLRI
jgi:hypothetical protein